jgi:hypothetical protein
VTGRIRGSRRLGCSKSSATWPANARIVAVATRCMRSPPNRTPGVCGWASGPATTSNSAFSGAGPIRRRKSRSAYSDGTGTCAPGSPAVSLPHTRA